MLDSEGHKCDALRLVLICQLSHDLLLLQPCYKWWEIPYYWAGLKAYDLVAGTQGLTISRFTSAG